MNIHQIELAFFTWRFQDCLNNLGRASLERKHPDWKRLTPYQIGSLVFTGDLSEALKLFEKTVSKISRAQIIESRFYLGVGNIRRSQYAEGAKYFAENLLAIRKGQRKSSRDRFFAYQGTAFLNFFKGHYFRAEIFANKAFEEALSDSFTYGEVLSLDLLAHSHCQLGKVRQGLHEFQKGIKLIRKLGNGGLETALRISELRYRAQFGIDHLSTVDELERALQNLKPEETYSKAELQLELSRQLILRGEASGALALLDLASDEVYRHQNRRQSAQFNFRYAHILFLRGEFHGALALLRSSVKELDPRVDLALRAQFRGLENCILKSLGKPELPFDRLPVNFVDQRIRSGDKNYLLKGEDPLGDLIEELAVRGILLLPELIQKKFLGLVPQALGSSRSGKKIILGPDRGQMIIVSGGDVVMVTSGLTAPLKKLLLNLRGQSFRSKGELVREVWGYDYNPATHDNVLYTNVSRLRNLMGKFGDWVEWSSEGYRIPLTVELTSPQDPKGPKQILTTQQQREPRSPKKILLNHRQILALKKIDAGEILDVSTHASDHGVTTMTACRDLTDLARRGLIQSVGRARATKYIKV
jgi:tetratricopeptide (TPR) repeat protein